MALRDVRMGLNVTMWNNVIPGDTAKLEVDNVFLDKHGVIDVRTGSTDPSYGGARQAIRDTSVFYKSKGKRVLHGITKVPGVSGLDDTTKDQHRIHILEEAQFCVDNNIDELFVGNEELGHLGNWTEAQVINFFRI